MCSLLVLLFLLEDDQRPANPNQPAQLVRGDNVGVTPPASDGLAGMLFSCAGKGLSLSLRGFNVYLYPAGSLRVSGLVVGVVPGFRYSVTAFCLILFFFF